jgi:ABC-type multidrug transport system ATPase subunit
LAVIVAADADLVLLDEPTAALDPDGLAAFHALVGRRRSAGRTTVFSSHQLEDVERLADRVAVLVEGRLAACLTAAELADRVAVHGQMRLQVSGLTTAALADVQLVSPGATAVDERLVVRGGATERPAVLAGLARHGVTITSLTVQEGRLDEWYRDLVANAMPRTAPSTDASESGDANRVSRALWLARALKARR